MDIISHIFPEKIFFHKKCKYFLTYVDIECIGYGSNQKQIFGQIKDDTVENGFSHSCCPFFFSNERSHEKEYRPVIERDDILIIQSSTIGSSASRRYSYNQTNYTEHTEWNNATGEFFQETSSESIQLTESSSSENGVFSLSISNDEETEDSPKKSVLDTEMEALKNRLSPLQTKGIPTAQERLKKIRDMQQKSLDYLLRILLGGDKKYGKNKPSRQQISSSGQENATAQTTKSTNVPVQNLGKGWSYSSFYYCEERETTCFDTKGTAVTADGRQLSFQISVEMSRSFVEMTKEKIDFGQPRLCDPLVINLNTNTASVSDQKFFFDIDADGKKEEISMLGKESGYLALDNNADGIINDGSELFGTQSGNGFKDLLAYDEDGNGWIDEADSIFRKLKVWSMDENGNSTLMDLKATGVGAIYLGYENTEFSLKNSANKTNAVIQKTGLFLYENGLSGTVQQMDLAV